VGRNTETIRRWIRSGRLPSTRVGTQHLVAEADLEEVAGQPETLPLPEEWTTLWTGDPQPDWVAIVRRSRSGH